MASYEYQKDIYAWIYYGFISTVSNGRPKENIFSKIVFFLKFFLFLSGLASVFTELIDWIQYPLFRSPYQYIWTRANDVTKVLL